MPTTVDGNFSTTCAIHGYGSLLMARRSWLNQGWEVSFDRLPGNPLYEGHRGRLSAGFSNQMAKLRQDEFFHGEADGRPGAGHG